MTKHPVERPEADGASIDAVRDGLLRWFPDNARKFPWRQTTDRFHILVAEMLLRQTQAFRLVDPYLTLVGRYPDPQSMANADVEELREWFQPLGLVRRADRLVRASQTIVRDHSGEVPLDLGALMAFPGLGHYSARAILCLATGAQLPMVDEGSGRVLRRVFGLAAAGPAYKDTKVRHLAERLVAEGPSRPINLGLIDVAANFCHARQPACEYCPLAGPCMWSKSAMA